MTAPPDRPAFPGVVVIDPREAAPYTFQELPLAVTTKTAHLLTGDYSLEGYTDRVAVERKSAVDIADTIAHRKQRFSAELDRMKAMDHAAVVVECTWDDLAEIPSSLPRGAVQAIVRMYVREYPHVHWRFCDGRRATEMEVYSILLGWAERLGGAQ